MRDAKDFVSFLTETWTTTKNVGSIVGLVRARDAEVIEECKAALCDIPVQSIGVRSMIPKLDALAALDALKEKPDA